MVEPRVVFCILFVRHFFCFVMHGVDIVVVRVCRGLADDGRGGERAPDVGRGGCLLYSVRVAPAVFAFIPLALGADGRP